MCLGNKKDAAYSAASLYCFGYFPSGLRFTGHGGLIPAQQVRPGFVAKIKIKVAGKLVNLNHNVCIIAWTFTSVNQQKYTKGQSLLQSIYLEKNNWG